MKKICLFLLITVVTLLSCFLTGCTETGNIFSPTATVAGTPETTFSPSPETPDATPDGKPTPSPVPSETPSPTPADDTDYAALPVSAPVLMNDPQSDVPALIISEVMSENCMIYPIEELDMECFDWVELYNTTDSPINLSDYCISDKKNKPEKYRLPDEMLEAHSYYLLICSGLELPGHACFKISKEGETLYLSDSGGITDTIDVPGDLRSNMSYGRYEGKTVYMIAPTPGSANYSGPVKQTLLPPVANLAGGLYEDVISVELSSEGEIFYTVDGTKPDSSSIRYTGPINVDSVLSLRACAIRNGVTSDIACFTYVVNKDHTMPIMTVSIPDECLNGEKGIYTNVKETYEYEALVTLIEDGKEAFSLACGFRLHGKDSRSLPKKNYMLKFRSEYGSSLLNYKVFENRDCTQFDALILRGGSEDYLNGMMRDELCTSIVDGTTELAVQAFKPVILYINGEYNGIYFIREHIDEYMIAGMYGVSPESVTIIYNYREAETGTMNEMQELIDFCKRNDLTVKENYDYVISKIDMNSLLDWYICRGFFGDKDYRNMRVFKTTEGDGKWHWTFYDLDWGVQNTSNTFSYILCTREDPIFCNLVRNEDFLTELFKRLNYLEETVLTAETAQGKIEYFRRLLLPEIEADRTYWHDYAPAWCNLNTERWERTVNEMIHYFDNEKRISALKKNIADYFGIPVEVLG